MLQGLLVAVERAAHEECAGAAVVHEVVEDPGGVVEVHPETEVARDFPEIRDSAERLAGFA